MQVGSLEMDQGHHETQLIQNFIRREKQDRLLSFLCNPNKRRKATDTLYHLRDLDKKHIVDITLNSLSPLQIAQALRERGAPKTCWVVSTNSELDAKEVDLETVLSDIVGGSEGSLLSCIPGKLAYYEGESPNNRYMLHKVK